MIDNPVKKRTELYRDRGPSYEWVNDSDKQVHKFITRDFKQPKELWSIEVLPGKIGRVPDLMYLVYTSDGQPAQGRMNFGDAKTEKKLTHK